MMKTGSGLILLMLGMRRGLGFLYFFINPCTDSSCSLNPCIFFSFQLYKDLLIYMKLKQEVDLIQLH